MTTTEPDKSAAEVLNALGPAKGWPGYRRGPAPEPAGAGLFAEPERVDAPTPLDQAIALVRDEVTRAQGLHAPMASSWEGYAVLLEELDELWDEVKAGKGPEGTARQLAEAVQVAAMAVRYLLDVCEVGR